MNQVGLWANLSLSYLSHAPGLQSERLEIIVHFVHGADLEQRGGETGLLPAARALNKRPHGSTNYREIHPGSSAQSHLGVEVHLFLKKKSANMAKP